MKPRFIYFYFLFLFFNCKDSKDVISSELIFEYHSDDYSFNKLNHYRLEVKKNDSLIKYNYIFKTDSQKNISAFYSSDDESISLPFAQFSRVNDKAFTITSISRDPFYYYENLDHSSSHVTEPLIFNENYGLLAIGNTYGLNFIFLKEEKDSILRQEIGNKLKVFHQ